MSAQLTTADSKSVSKKRKRTGAAEESQIDGTKKVAKSSAPSAEDVLEFEEAIVDSPQNYNKIVTLLEYVQVCFLELHEPAVLIMTRFRTRPRIQSWR